MLLYVVFAISFLVTFGTHIYLTRIKYAEQWISKNGNLKPVLSFPKLLQLLFAPGIYKPNWVLYQGKPSKKEAILKALRKLAVVVCGSSFIFSVLQWYLDHTTDLDFALATVWQFESSVRTIESWIKWIKPEFPWDLIIAIAFVLFSGLFGFLEQWRLREKYDKAIKYTGLSLYTLSILTSFTFFGHRFAEGEQGRADKMKWHAAQIIHDNKLLYRDIRLAQRERVINQLLKDPTIFQTLDKNELHSKKQEEIKQLTEELSSEEDELYIQPILHTLAVPVNLKQEVQNIKKVEESFQKSYSPDYEYPRNYTEDIYNLEFEQFYQENKQEFDKQASRKSTEEARAAFEQEIKETKTELPKFMQDYKEAGEILYKEAFKSTIGSLIKQFTKQVGETAPFLSELIEVFITDPLENALQQKAAESILRIHKKSYMSVTEYPKPPPSTNTQIYAKWIALMNKLDQLHHKVETAKMEIKAYRTQKRIKKFNELVAKSRWENVRRLVLHNGINCPYFIENESAYKSALKEWEDYLKENKENIAVYGVEKLETLFSDYSPSRHDLLEAFSRGILWQYGHKVAEAGFEYTIIGALQYYCKMEDIPEEKFTDFFNRGLSNPNVCVH